MIVILGIVENIKASEVLEDRLKKWDTRLEIKNPYGRDIYGEKCF